MEGRSLCMGAIVKLDRPFRAAAITQMTDLPRQTVYHHLNKFVAESWLEKHGTVYTIVDREMMIDKFVDVQEDKSVRDAKGTAILDSDVMTGVNSIARLFAAARILRLDVATELRLDFLEEIDKSINELKTVKRIVTSAQPTRNTSVATVNDKAGALYDRMTETYGSIPSMNRSTFIDTWDAIMEEIAE